VGRSNRMAVIGASTVTLASVYAPKRSGNMVRSINAGPVRSNGTTASVTVSVDVPYATYVLKGTYGPIHAGLRRDVKGRFSSGKDSRGRKLSQRKKMAVGRSQGRTTSYRLMVAGQSANDFLTRAADEVVARHTR